MPLFRFAELKIRISFAANQPFGMRLLPSFAHFETEDKGDTDILFNFTANDSLQPVERAKRTRIRDFDTGNGITVVDEIEGGGYQFIIKDINGKECSLLITNKDFSDFKCALNGNYNMRSFGLNNALMLSFSFAGAFKDTVLMHASLVRQDGYGYAFIAKSGTGKSTQVSSWLRYLPGCDLMNDDNPIVRIINGKPYIYGSPWSGKTPCYRNVKAKIGAITRIDRAQRNFVERLDPVNAFASLLPSISTMKWEKKIYDKTCDTVSRLVETVNIYTLHCLPDRESAEICNKAIKKQ